MGVRQKSRSVALRLPVLGRLIRERAQFAAERDHALLRLHHVWPGPAVGNAAMWMPPGHFYSPLPSLDEVAARYDQIFRPDDRELLGIDLRTHSQRALLDEFAATYASIPFPADRSDRYRYYFDNPAYSWSDGIIFHSMLRKLRPNRIIEVGSGYSSALALDTNELFLDGATSITFIEPYPELLSSLIRDSDPCEIIPLPVQDVPVSRFEELEAGDILFIDSTHAAKAGGDVNYLYFEVLPRLKAGVYIHIHDIFDGFEYPPPWVMEGRGWTEQYVLRAMLMHNARLEVVFFNTYMERVEEAWFAEHMPNCLRNRGGSIWLRTVQP